MEEADAGMMDRGGGREQTKKQSCVEPRNSVASSQVWYTMHLLVGSILPTPRYQPHGTRGLGWAN